MADALKIGDLILKLAIHKLVLAHPAECQMLAVSVVHRLSVCLSVHPSRPSVRPLFANKPTAIFPHMGVFRV